MTKNPKHFAHDLEITEPITFDEYVPLGYETYSDVGRVAHQATHRGLSRAAVFALTGVATSVLLAGTIFLNSPVKRTIATAETSALSQTNGATKNNADAKAKAEAEAKKAAEKVKTEAMIAESEKAKEEAEAKAKKAEEERAQAEVEAKAAEERAASSEVAAEKAEPHTAGESVTIALPTAPADVYAEWGKDSDGNWWACFSTYNGTAVQATPAQDGGWLFYAVTDNGLVQIQRVNESAIEDESGPGGISSHWTDCATNTVWY